MLRALSIDLAEAGHRLDELEGGLRLPDLDDRIVVLGHPLTASVPGSAAGRELAGNAEHVAVIDQLLVDRALPAAVKVATGIAGATGAGPTLPAFLPATDSGCPVYDVDQLATGRSPEPLGHVTLEEASEESFLVRLDVPTLERLNSAFSVGAWVLIERTAPESYPERPRGSSPRLVLSEGASFNATGCRWTFGIPTRRRNASGLELAHITYYSHVAPRSEAIPVSQACVFGRARGVFVDGVLKPVGGS